MGVSHLGDIGGEARRAVPGEVSRGSGGDTRVSLSNGPREAVGQSNCQQGQRARREPCVPPARGLLLAEGPEMRGNRTDGAGQAREGTPLRKAGLGNCAEGR